MRGGIRLRPVCAVLDRQMDDAATNRSTARVLGQFGRSEGHTFRRGDLHFASVRGHVATYIGGNTTLGGVIN
jgi:hypothetical protein